METKTINEKASAYLNLKGNTKASLASELGMSVATLQNRLNGSLDWQWEEVRALAKILGCSVSAFE